jgi:hypothetical protein
VPLISKAHYDEPDVSHDGGLRDLFDSRSDGDDGFDICWRANFGSELQDPLLGSLNADARVHVLFGPQAFKPPEWSDLVNEQQRDLKGARKRRGGAHFCCALICEIACR